MTKRMLIDTTHAEETRVVVMDGNRLEDYDVETSAKKQLKGNIYLAKVIRVEPSLQAAFVEYGGNRHGFLAFSEIHPDYYQIPIADREKLLALQEEEVRAEEARAAREDEADDVATADEGGSVAADADPDEDGAGHRHAPETVGGEHDTGDDGAAQRRTARFLRNYKIQEVIRRRQVILVQVVKEERGNKGAALTTYISLAGRYCVLMPNALRGGGVSRKITSVSDRKRLRDTIASLELPRGMSMIVRTAGAQRPQQEIIRDCEYLLHLWDDIRELTLQSVAPALVYEEASLIKRAIRDVYTRDIEEIVVDGETAWKSTRDFMRMLMPQSAHKVHAWKASGQSLFAHYQVEGHLDAMFLPTAQLRSGGYLVINQTEALVSIDVNSGRSTRERNIEETALRTNLEAADEVARQLRLRDLSGLIVIDFIDMESRKHNAMVERRLKDALRSDRARIQVGSISHFGLLEMSRQRLRPSIAESVFTTCPHCQGTGVIRGTESAALHVLRAIDEEGSRGKAAEITVNVAGAIALYILNHKRAWLSEIERRHHMLSVFVADDSILPPQFRIERVRPQTERQEAEPRHDLSAPVIEAPGVVREIPIAADQPPESALAEGSTIIPAPTSEDGEDEPRRKRRRRRRRRGGRQEDEAMAAGQGGVADQAADSDEDDAESDDDVVSATPVAAAPAESAPGELMPGRRRTRSRRRSRGGQTDQADEAQVPAAERPVQRSEARPQNRPAERPAWRGPTPANPFGGEFDIFDVIERSERLPVDPVGAPVSRSTQDSVRAPVAMDAPLTERPVTVPAAVVAEASVAEEDAPRKPGRRRTRRTAPVAAEEPVAESTPVVDAEPEATVADPAEEAPKPTRRRRTTKAKATEPVEAAVVAAEPVMPVSDEAAPARTRRRT
ncbi:Rne/Rng family ribonuclease, partial [Ameyamaea chiangmaiensis]